MERMLLVITSLLNNERIVGVQQTRVTPQMCYDAAMVCRNVARCERELRVLLLVQLRQQQLHAPAAAAAAAGGAASASAASTASTDPALSVECQNFTIKINQRLAAALELFPHWQIAPVRFVESAYQLANECCNARMFAEQELYGANTLQRRNEVDRQTIADMQQDTPVVANPHSAAVAAAEDAADPILAWYTDGENVFRLHDAAAAQALSQQLEQFRRMEAETAKTHASLLAVQNRLAEMEAAKAREEADARAHAAQQEQLRHAEAEAAKAAIIAFEESRARAHAASLEQFRQAELRALAKMEQEKQLRQAEAEAAKAAAIAHEESRARAHAASLEHFRQTEARAMAKLQQERAAQPQEHNQSAQPEQLRQVVAKAYAEQRQRREEAQAIADRARGARVQAAPEDEAPRMVDDAAMTTPDPIKWAPAVPAAAAAAAASAAPPAANPPSEAAQRIDDARRLVVEAFCALPPLLMALDGQMEEEDDEEGSSAIDRQTRQMNVVAAQQTVTRRLVALYRLRWSAAANDPLCAQVQLLLQDMWQQLNRSGNAHLTTNEIITASNRWNQLREEVRSLLNGRDPVRDGTGQRTILFVGRRFAYLQSIVDATLFH
jgi:hypothetical protein